MTGGHRVAPGPAGEGREGRPAGELGMWIFLASLTMLFGASLVGFTVIRLRLDSWSGTVDLPAGLWVSTLILALASGALIAGHRAIRAGRRALLGRWLGATLALGVAFVVCQVLNLAGMHRAGTLPQTSMAAYAVYVLATLHGLHVLGGLVAMVVVLIRNALGTYSAASHGGVRYLGMYWHYLGVVWVVLWIVLAV